MLTAGNKAWYSESYNSISVGIPLSSTSLTSLSHLDPSSSRLEKKIYLDKVGRILTTMSVPVLPSFVRHTTDNKTCLMSSEDFLVTADIFRLGESQ